MKQFGFLLPCIAALAAASACATTTVTEDSGPVVIIPQETSAPLPPCASNAVRCGTICTDTRKDRNNCGGCGLKCSPGEFCTPIGCSKQCPQPYEICGEQCIDPFSDLENCGKCDNACLDKDREVCDNGSCIKKCAKGLALCNNKDCFDLTSDRANCGSCGNACEDGKDCNGSICCPTGQQNCAGTCVATTFDDTNCGQCGTTCNSPNPYCVGGACNSCNPTVLLIMYSVAQYQKAFQDAFAAAGLKVEIAPGFTYNYSGTPDPKNYGAVFVDPGYGYTSYDMPYAGQTAIVAAQQAGVGVFMTGGYYYYIAYYGTYTTLRTIIPWNFTTASPTYLSSFTVTGVQTSHPIWNGFGTSFSSSTYGYMAGGSQNGGTLVANCSNQPCVVAKDPGGSVGRTAYLGPEYIYSSSIYTDKNMMKLLTNTATWVNKCR